MAFGNLCEVPADRHKARPISGFFLFLFKPGLQLPAMSQVNLGPLDLTPISRSMHFAAQSISLETWSLLVLAKKHDRLRGDLLTSQFLSDGRSDIISTC